jgi:signal transduction histidine kinase
MSRAEPPTSKGLEGTIEDDFGALLALLDPDVALQQAAQLVTAEVGLPVGFVAVPSGPDAVLICRSQGTRTKALHGVLVPAGFGLGGKVAASGAPAWVRDYCTNGSITHHFDPPVQAEGLQGMIAVPLRRDGTFYGVLYGADRQERDFGARAAGAMEAVAAKATLALQVAERTRHAAEIAVHQERLRLSIALHDSVGALLFAIGAGARELAAVADVMPGIAERALEIESRAASAALALRRSLRALHSTPEELALAVALQSDCSAFQERTGIRARAIALTELPPLPAGVTQALVAAVREALLNVEKHAAAGSVMVTVAAHAGGVAVAVADDGQGPRGGGDGLGLEAAAVRLGRVGGTLHLTGNDDGGATLRAWIPC